MTTMKKSATRPQTKPYLVCLVLPYHATIYRDGYTPPGEKQTPYLTQWGRVYVELTTKDITILEQGGPHYEKTRARAKEIAQKGLEEDMTSAIEQHEGIGGFNSWILPLVTRRYASFIMLTSVKSVLRGTHVDWKKRKTGIYFTAKV